MLYQIYRNVSSAGGNGFGCNTFVFLKGIFLFVAVATLDECCMSSEDIQWLIHSGEQTVALGPLVFLWWSILDKFYKLIKVT